MSQTAANLVHLVLPDQTIRQWTVSLPFELRLPVARDSALLTAVQRIIVSEIDKLYKRLGQERGVRGGATGIVAATHFFGGSLNLNPHWHNLSVDGVFSAKPDGDGVVFTETRAPAQSEVRDLAQQVHQRVVRMMRRRGLLRDEADGDVAEVRPLEACAQLSLRLGKLGHVDKLGVVHEPDPDEAREGFSATESSATMGARNYYPRRCEAQALSGESAPNPIADCRARIIERDSAPPEHGLDVRVGAEDLLRSLARWAHQRVVVRTRIPAYLLQPQHLVSQLANRPRERRQVAAGYDPCKILVVPDEVRRIDIVPHILAGDRLKLLERCHCRVNATKAPWAIVVVVCELPAACKVFVHEG